MRTTLSADETTLCKQIGKQYSQLVELLDRLRTAELEAMALGGGEHFMTYKGRVTMLTELRQHFRPQP